MKQADIRVGEIYVIGDPRRRGGILPTSRRIRVTETNVCRPYSKRADSVRGIQVDEDGNERLHATDSYTARIHPELCDKPIEIIVATRRLMTVKAAEAVRRENQVKQAAKLTLARMCEGIRQEISDRICNALGLLESEGISIGVNVEGQVTYIQFTSSVVENLMLVLDHYIDNKPA